MDDTIASSKTFEEHLHLLRRIFQSYRDHGLLVNLKKTKLFRKSVDFLSLNLFEEVLPPMKEGTEKIMEWPHPERPKDALPF